MDLNLKNKVFIVTGGSQGIGAGITGHIIAEGGIVVIATLSQDKDLSILKSEFKAQDHQLDLIIGDLQASETCKQVIDKTASTFGRIDGIVNNAGNNDSKGLEAGPEAFRKSLSRNLLHYYDLVHYGLPWLKESKGVIVNIASKVAFTGQGGTSGYAAAKGGVLALTREWAAELLPSGIRVNAVLPSEVMTPLYRSWLDQFEDPQEREAEIAQKIPLERRMTTPAEIGATVAFLLSDQSSHTTGQWHFVDGGYVHLDRGLS